MHVNGQWCAPATLPPASTELEARWAADVLQKRNICCLCRKPNTALPAKSTVTTLTELYRLQK